MKVKTKVGDKTKEKLIREVVELRRQNAKLNASFR